MRIARNDSSIFFNIFLNALENKKPEGVFFCANRNFGNVSNFGKSIFKSAGNVKKECEMNTETAFKIFLVGGAVAVTAWYLRGKLGVEL